VEMNYIKLLGACTSLKGDSGSTVSYGFICKYSMMCDCTPIHKCRKQAYWNPFSVVWNLCQALLPWDKHILRIGIVCEYVNLVL
jgi:hypothetical protein